MLCDRAEKQNRIKYFFYILNAKKVLISSQKSIINEIYFFTFGKV